MRGGKGIEWGTWLGFALSFVWFVWDPAVPTIRAPEPKPPVPCTPDQRGKVFYGPDGKEILYVCVGSPSAWRRVRGREWDTDAEVMPPPAPPPVRYMDAGPAKDRPVSCRVGDKYAATDTGVLYECHATPKGWQIPDPEPAVPSKEVKP